MTKIQEFQRLFRSLPFLASTSSSNSLLCTVSGDKLGLILRFLRDHVLSQYKILGSISLVDYPNRNLRFEVIYELLSIRWNHRLRLKTWTDSKIPLGSAIDLYSSANWYEREGWDLFGVSFHIHKDLRRILTDYGFQGHPLRKDFPLSGLVELRYGENVKRVIPQSIHLDQSFRIYNFHYPLGIETKTFV
jgi:NADH dehydrogenase (ubiquinone) Fe-S protein 3